jgi:hypothetical protein
LVAEGLELADEVAGLADGVEMALVPVGAEFLVLGVGVVDQVPDGTRMERATATTALAWPRRLTMRR